MNIGRVGKEKIPEELLLLADPDSTKIRAYPESALYWAAAEEEMVVGVLVMKVRGDHSGEILNVAVAESFRNKKIGRELLEKAQSAIRRNTVVGMTGRKAPTMPRPTLRKPKASKPYRRGRQAVGAGGLGADGLSADGLGAVMSRLPRGPCRAPPWLAAP